MAGGCVSNSYARITDIDYLRAVVDTLSGLVEEIEEDREVTSDSSGADRPRLAGQRAVRAMALRRRAWALTRLNELIVGAPERCPVVLDPVEQSVVSSVQGQPLTPLITSGKADTVGLSSAQVWMSPGHAAHAHVHHHTDVGVVVLQGRAVTLWWDKRGVRHELVQSAGEHLHIPFGLVHAAINPFGQPVVAAEFRPNRFFSADNERVRALDRDVSARLATLQGVAA